MKKNFIIAALLALTGALSAQNYSVVKEPGVFPVQSRLNIQMPQIEGYEIIKGDFHLHTVFSDGTVWPDVRVREAWRDGLDAIAISDHVEYRPFKEYINASLNRVYDIALPEAEEYGIILIRAAEITRSMPPGHLNALFVQNIDALEKEHYRDALSAAYDQGAFIFWNHPGWQAQQPDTCLWWDEHEELYQHGLIHGIEIYNFDEWYPSAIDWARDKSLAFLANSDFHEPMPHIRGYSKFFRPMTLVFAREKTAEAIREAFENRQTVAFFAGKLAGQKYWLEKIFFASVRINKVFKPRIDGLESISITNLTDIPMVLETEAGSIFNLEAVGTVTLPVPRLEENEGLPLKVTNFLTGSRQHLEVQIVL